MIELKNLTKKFGDVCAVDHLNLKVETGEFLGLLGVNGAGKTTTISMISTVLLPTEGEIIIDGKKLDRRASDVKRKLSVVTQEYSMRQDMTLEEVMEYQGRLYLMKKRDIMKKTDELFEFAGLSEHKKKTVRQLSGGMKRKLMVCRGLLTDPEIMLLDEPTAGMDAISRRQMRNLLRRLNESNITIILTTHYIEEAQSLCDRIALMDKGKLDITGQPLELIDGLGKYAVDLIDDEDVVSRYFDDRDRAIGYLTGIKGKTVMRETSLEDVFIERIGKHLSG